MNEISKPKSPDDGTGYGRPASHSNKLLTEVGPGKPMGELFRRYWLPVGIAKDVGSTPKQVRVLGEDLILFRDGQGRPGLLHNRCCHRGTTLYYGRVEEDGIRCCYHGWLFDVEGHCLDQPCEPNHGEHRDKARQPWYPVQELYGLVFAYMGPPDRKPIIPRYDIFEDVAEGEGFGNTVRGGATGDNSVPVGPYSWLQRIDNIMDPFHVQVLHSTFSSVMFAPEMVVMPICDFFPTESGVCYSATRDLGDGRMVDRISSWLLPAISSVPNTKDESGAMVMKHSRSTRVAWVVPVDDDHFVQYQAFKKGVGAGAGVSLAVEGKTWGEMTEAERRRFPGDYEAQMGQGAISLHSEEHLATSDRGIVMLRRMMEQQIRTIQEGGDPLGVHFKPEEALVNIRSGEFFRNK